MPQNPTKPNHIYLAYTYKEDLALNNLQWLICHKTTGFDTGFERPACLATLKSSDRTKQSVC